MGLRLVRDQLNDTLLTCCWCWCWRCSNYAVLSSQTASRNSTASGIQTAQSVFHATLWAGHHSRQSLIDTVQSLSLYRCTVDTSNRQTCQDGLSLIVGWHSVLCAQYVWKQREAADDCSTVETRWPTDEASLRVAWRHSAARAYPRLAYCCCWCCCLVNMHMWLTAPVSGDASLEAQLGAAQTLSSASVCDAAAAAALRCMATPAPAPHHAR